jgi:porin
MRLKIRTFASLTSGCALAVGVLGPGAAAAADEPPQPLHLSLLYKVGVVSDVSGGVQRGTRVLDDLMVNADADLGAAFGWNGATAHASFLNNFGERPNDLAGTLQGIDNIEVANQRAKLYEAWIDQAFAGGAVDVRFGLYDTNSELDATDSAAIFLEPTFGISTEIAATGPNGPSIFPSPALALRVNVQPRKDVYVRLAAVDANAGTVGDPGGVDTSLRSGLLVWGEAGWTGQGKLAAGAWGYTRGQPDIRAVDAAGAPRRSASRGAYVMVDQPLPLGDGGPKASAFLRLGVSDGDTTPFNAAGSAGVTATHLFSARPDATLALGISWAILSPKYRANAVDAGAPVDAAETSVEITYADKIGSHLTLQPDIQYIRRPAGDLRIKDSLVLGLRATVSY